MGSDMRYHALVCSLLLCLVLATLLGSCGWTGKEDPRSLRFVWFGSEDETRAIRSALEEFERENPGYRVTLQPVEWTKYNEKVMTMLLGRRAPDLARMSAQWGRRYDSLEALADIRPWLDEDDLQDFVPSRLASCMSDERLYGLPQTSIGLMVFYNLDLFEQAGLTVPESPEDAWSWEEFSSVARQLQEQTGVKFGWGTFRGWFPFLTFIYQNGGRLLHDGQPDFAAEANVAALQWFVEQHQQGIASRSAWSRSGDPVETLFLRGDCAMVITGNWRLVTYARQIQDFRWGVTYLPRAQRRATNIGGENLVVFNTSKAESATHLLRFLTRADVLERFCTETMFLPTRQSLLELELPYRVGSEALKKFAIQSQDFELEWAAEQSTEEFAKIESVFLKEIELAVLGMQTPRQSLEAINREYRSVRLE